MGIRCALHPNQIIVSINVDPSQKNKNRLYCSICQEIFLDAGGSRFQTVNLSQFLDNPLKQLFAKEERQKQYHEDYSKYLHNSTYEIQQVLIILCEVLNQTAADIKKLIDELSIFLQNYNLMIIYWLQIYILMNIQCPMHPKEICVYLNVNPCAIGNNRFLCAICQEKLLDAGFPRHQIVNLNQFLENPILELFRQKDRQWLFDQRNALRFYTPDDFQKVCNRLTQLLAQAVIDIKKALDKLNDILQDYIKAILELDFQNRHWELCMIQKLNFAPIREQIRMLTTDNNALMESNNNLDEFLNKLCYPVTPCFENMPQIKFPFQFSKLWKHQLYDKNKREMSSAILQDYLLNFSKTMEYIRVNLEKQLFPRPGHFVYRGPCYFNDSIMNFRSCSHTLLQQLRFQTKLINNLSKGEQDFFYNKILGKISSSKQSLRLINTWSDSNLFDRSQTFSLIIAKISDRTIAIYSPDLKLQRNSTQTYRINETFIASITHQAAIYPYIGNNQKDDGFQVMEETDYYVLDFGRQQLNLYYSRQEMKFKDCTTNNVNSLFQCNEEGVVRDFYCGNLWARLMDVDVEFYK